MRIRHLLFFFPLICLSGCFAVYIPNPEPNALPIPTSESAVVAFSVDNYQETAGNSRLNRFIGTKSVGHQYLFPGFPITRLYFEREIADVFGEFLLFHPKLGRGFRAVTNLSSMELRQLFGPKSATFKIDIENFSATAQDFFFLRKAAVNGKINFSLNNSISEALEFNSSRFISKASVEVLSELIEESLFNSLQDFNLPKTTNTPTNTIAQPTTIICIFESPKVEKTSCLSKNSVSIGVEHYFRIKNLPFVSFRDGCPNTLPIKGYSLSIRVIEIANENNTLKLSGQFILGDLGNQNRASAPVKSQLISKTGSLDSSSSEPECSGARKVSEQLIEEFFHNG